MRILFISTYCDPSTGASALVRLQKRVNALGHHSKILTIENPFSLFEGKDIIKVPASFLFNVLNINQAMSKAMRKLLNRTFPFIYDIYGYMKPLLREINRFRPDVVNVHWTHGSNYIPLGLIPVISKHQFVFWTLHDMWPITGMCPFPLTGCSHWRTGCSRCPERGVSVSCLMACLPRMNWNIKKRFFQKSNIITISPSQWMRNCAKESIFFKESEHYLIPYGLDIGRFKPCSKNTSRLELQIPEEHKVILTLSTPANSPRKGAAYFLKAVRLLWEAHPGLRNQISILVIGDRSSEVKQDIPFNVVAIGRIKNEQAMARIYSASDVYAMPSLADNLPSTILESMACQTPVVAFDSGGIGDMVRSSTGFLVKKGDIAGLTRNIHKLLSHDDFRKNLGENCRNFVTKEYNIDLSAKRYLELFKKYTTKK